MHSQESGVFQQGTQCVAAVIGVTLRLSLRKYRNKEFDVYLHIRMLRYSIQYFSKLILNSLDTIRAS